MKILFLLWLSCVGSIGCQKQTTIGTMKYGGGYSYVEVSPGVFHIIARSNADLHDAMTEIGCQICIVDDVGRYFVVEKVKSK